MTTAMLRSRCLGEVNRWKGDAGRAMRVQRPCECGCDLRDGKKGVGYITGSDKNGNGFTIWITNESLYQIMEKSFKASKK